MGRSMISLWVWVAFLIGLLVAGAVSPFLLVVWHFVGRPVALALRLIEPTAADLVARGWKAERDGQAADALAADDEALRLSRRDQEVEARRAALLDRHPDLAPQAERAERDRLVALGPVEFLEHFEGRVTDRKLRLVAVACCRRVWDRLDDDRLRAAVDAAERHADQPLPGGEARAIYTAASPAGGPGPDDEARAAAVLLAPWARAIPHHGTIEVVMLTAATVGAAEQAKLVRCVVGLPHREREVSPSWATSTVLSLARRMYESGDFSAFPILADALQDAGCENADILNHYREPGPHARGCWVIDAILGKE
ncbi:MAG: hypothetical protein JWO38_4411 [Gemmataceae bacterium]|nr:hypothetical protein [Gemmataceae bacterium]